jgi:hypothetical protein
MRVSRNAHPGAGLPVMVSSSRRGFGFLFLHVQNPGSQFILVLSTRLTKLVGGRMDLGSPCRYFSAPIRSGSRQSNVAKWPEVAENDVRSDVGYWWLSRPIMLTLSFVGRVESPGGISPPGAPKTVREPLDSHGSRCSTVGTRATGFTSSTGSSCCQMASVGPWPRLNNAAPSVQPHYRAFIPTTGHSAPVLRIGTLALAVGAACGFSLGIGATGSHVPYKSQVELRAAYMPDAARAVSGLPPS